MLSNKLEWFIAQGKKFNWPSQPFAATIRAMIKTRHHEWGFVIYRCAYGDDGAWKRYMECFEKNVHRGLESCGGDVIVGVSATHGQVVRRANGLSQLPQYAKWTVKEDHETLNGATIDAAREMFVKWRDEYSVEQEVHWVDRMMPLLTDPPSRLPRFTYCLYVDQKCLNTVNAHSESNDKVGRAAKRRPPTLVAALIDADFDESLYVQGGLRATPDERGHFPAVDGRTCGYVGSEYVDTRGLDDQYDRLHYLRMDHPIDYRRPPWVLGQKIMTDDGLRDA